MLIAGTAAAAWTAERRGTAELLSHYYEESLVELLSHVPTLVPSARPGSSTPRHHACCHCRLNYSHPY